MPVLRTMLLLLAIYSGWLTFMAVHEFGHVLHAWITGGSVERVSLPLFGFSRTDLRSNPRPLVVAWGGAIWGCLIPAALLPLGRLVARLRTGLLAFAGFCLIANGAYLAFGSFLRAGDAGDLLQHDTPAWILWLFGAVTMSAGLCAWHVIGKGRRTPMSSTGLSTN